MPYKVTFSPGAVRHLRRLRAFERTKVQEAIELHLKTKPTQETKSTIKRLRQPAPTNFRLRVDPLRVYYNVDEDAMAVSVLAVLSKDESLDWLKRGAEDAND